MPDVVPFGHFAMEDVCHKVHREVASSALVLLSVVAPEESDPGRRGAQSR